MSITKSAKLHDHFTDLADPRRREVTYPLINIVHIFKKLNPTSFTLKSVNFYIFHNSKQGVLNL